MPEPTQAHPSHALSAPFRWFLTGRTIDLAGTAMTPVTLSLSVLQATGSASRMGWVMAASVIPTLVFMLAGGVAADRWQRTRVLVLSSACSGIVGSAMAAMLLSGRFNLAAMMALSALSGVVSGFNGPALRGIVPELVDPSQVQRANATLASTRNVTRIAGPLLAGILVSTIGGGWALAFDAATSLVAATCFTRLPISTRAAVRQGIGRDLADGWATFRSLCWVWTLSLTYAAVNLLNVGPWQVLGPLVLSRHHPLAAWGMVQSARAVGLLLASTALIRLRFRNPLVAGLLLGLTMGIPLITLGLSDSPVILAVTAAVGAIGSTASGITYDSTLQTHVPADKLSRVASYDDLLAFLTVPISQAATGPVATLTGAQHLALGSGIALMAVLLLPLLSADVRHISSR